MTRRSDPIVRRSLGLSAAVVVAALAAPAHAAYFKGYAANAATTAPDPTSVEGGGWGLVGTSPTFPVKAPGSDATGNYWRVTDTNTNPTTGAAANSSAGYIVQQAASGTGIDPLLANVFTDPEGWKASVTLKLLDGRVANAAAGTNPLFIDIRTDTDGIGTANGRIVTLGLFQNDPAIANGVWWTPGGSSATGAGSQLLRGMDLSDGFHTIDVYFDRDAADAANNRLFVFVDGTQAFTILESAASVSGGSRMQVFQAASGATHDVEYRSFSIQNLVPEPTSLAAVGLAATALVRRRRA